MKIDLVINTDGKGKFSDEARPVRITELKLAKLSTVWFPDDPVTGELRAFFNSDGYNPLEWNVGAYGLIYTDKLWIREFKIKLRELGFTVRAVRDVSYSTEDMQGDNYVALEFGPEFYKSWERLNRTESDEQS